MNPSTWVWTACPFGWNQARFQVFDGSASLSLILFIIPYSSQDSLNICLVLFTVAGVAVSLMEKQHPQLGTGKEGDSCYLGEPWIPTF